MAIVADLAVPSKADTSWAGYGGASGGSYTTLTDEATITPNLASGAKDNFTVTLGGNRTIANPINAKAGMWVFFRIKQDATGSRVPTWGSAYKWPNNVTPALSTAANATDHIAGFVHDASNIECSILRGY